jgi:hypothetical protein
VLFPDEAGFGRDGIINFHNYHQWAEDNHYCVLPSGQKQQFSINVGAGIVGFCLVGPHVLPQWLIGEL